MSQGSASFGIRPAPCPLSLTRPTVLTVLWNRFSPVALILIVRVPSRPVRRNLYARRSRPASTRGLLGQPDRLVPTCKRSEALPVHCALSAMISRTKSRHRIGTDADGARRPKCALAGGCPEREVSHARWFVFLLKSLRFGAKPWLPSTTTRNEGWCLRHHPQRRPRP
jgi:hypothetical protein